AELAESILGFCREHLAAYKRIRRIEFADLPKTISGKIRRVELRRAEEDRHRTGSGPGFEYRDIDFPNLRKKTN
ncbi:AMP-binding protein, partial [Glutamicibacter sp. AOP5-A2-7]